MSVKGSAESFVELRGSLSLPEAIHGKSAYELAVMHGFEGTEAEWVHYLRYAKDGLTPYIGVNGHWWIGTQDTGVHAEGKDGVNGLTPYIGENGDWWIGEADTGVIAGTPKYMCGTGLMYEGETSLAPNKVYFLIEGDDDIPLTYLSAVASGTEDIEVGGTALEVGTVYFKYDEATDEPTTVTFTIDGREYTVADGTTWGEWIKTSDNDIGLTAEDVGSNRGGLINDVINGYYLKTTSISEYVYETDVIEAVGYTLV